MKKADALSGTNHRRRRLLVDPAVQGALLVHIVAHWLLFLITAGAFLFFIEMMSGDPRDAWNSFLRRHGPTALAVLILAPIFLRDLCRLSNRFAGPVLRLRRAMRDLADGRRVLPIQFREHDYWKELAADFNRVVEFVQPPSTTASSDPTAAHRETRDEPDQTLARARRH